MEKWLPLAIGVIGIISTLLAWFLNPKRRIQAELDAISKKLEVLYVQRDEALQKNDSDSLTAITSQLVKLYARKAVLLQ